VDLRVVGGEELAKALPMEAAVAALEAAFASDRPPEAPPRAHHEVGRGSLLVMPAWSEAGAGVKLITVNPSNPEQGLPFVQGVYVLFAAATLEPVAVIDGEALTAIRTAAVSGVATEHLARREARRLVIFGAGTQAHSHLEAMAAVRPIEQVAVISRTRERAEDLASKAHAMGLKAEVTQPEAVAEADLVCTCTTSREPLFEGSLLAKGAHVNAVGAFEPDARELDDAVIATAGLVVVETREAALEEAGDVVIPIRSGALDEASLTELSDVVRGRTRRQSDGDTTVFKSVGVAFEDLVVARAAAERLA
jgi:ornithine cyclodeaminase/alanine dehydrogenase-like protein (mu-crystallin family)